MLIIGKGTQHRAKSTVNNGRVELQLKIASAFGAISGAMLHDKVGVRLAHSIYIYREGDGDGGVCCGAM